MNFNTGAIPVIDVKGIGPSYTKILNRFGIHTTGDFLEKTQYPKDRHKLSKITGINDKRITKWASICDLIRVEGIAETWSELLIELGIHTVQGLAKEDFHALWSRIDHHQLRKGDMIKKKPTKDNVHSWLKDAQKLEAILHMKDKQDVPKVIESKPQVIRIVEQKEPPKIMSIPIPRKMPLMREIPMAENHIGQFEKTLIIVSAVILISILVLYMLLLINPAWI